MLDDGHRRLAAIERRLSYLEMNPAPTVPQYDLNDSTFFIGNRTWISLYNNTVEYYDQHSWDYPVPLAYILWTITSQYGGSLYDGSWFPHGWGSPSFPANPPFNTGPAHGVNIADQTWHHVKIEFEMVATGNQSFPYGIGPTYDYHEWYTGQFVDGQLNIETAAGSGPAAPKHLMFADVDPWTMLVKSASLNGVNQYISNLSIKADGAAWFHDFSDGTFGPFSTLDGHDSNGNSLGGWVVVEFGGRTCAYGQGEGYLYRNFSSNPNSVTIQFDYNSGNTNP